ncbi:FIG01201466: hypothetical protein [hydrothermal vent metagenome]|uniref:Alginate export domain-containing protein n=1 Tax=hydrothermal vent metagenome TaxID=652676 RepID=A0A3B0X3L0_9ZZZZ
MKATLFITIISIAMVFSGNVNSGKFSGYIGGQTRNFIEDPLSSEQHNNYLSAITEPEFFHEWDDGTQNVEVKLFYRVDQYDDERTHGDIRELSWTGVYDSWEVRAGISKVYWGVAETQHLVDIVNQTDQVENVDGEDKLGQPMIRLSTERDWGVVDLFVLPGFRERTFAGLAGRPRPEVIIDTNRNAIYDSSDKKDRIDFAARYSHYIGEWEFGLSLFTGTGREPTNFSPVAVNETGAIIVVPVYSLINQIGIDGQAFFGDWTWKLEAANTEVRTGDKKGINSFRSITGFEYTLVGLADSQMDLGFVVEYHYSDNRIINTIFDNDFATALRFVLNDAQSTQVLAGFTTDADTQTIGSFIEASRRLGDSWTFEAQLRTFHGTKEGRPLYSFRFDDFAQLDLNYHF